MEELDRELKRVLEGRVGALQAKPSMPSKALKQTKTRRYFVVTTTALLGAALVGAGFIGAQAFTGKPRTKSPAFVAPAAAEPEASPSPPMATSSVVTVASGRKAGSDWSLRAYTAEGQDKNTSGLPMLCVEWKFASAVEGDDFNCVIDESGVFEGPLMFQLMNDGIPTNAFFGPVPSATTRVELKLEDGSMQATDLFGSPDQLRTSNKFFVGFTTSDKNPLVIGFDDDGAVVFQRGDFPDQ